jgi:hypothetical protein
LSISWSIIERSSKVHIIFRKKTRKTFLLSEKVRTFAMWFWKESMWKLRQSLDQLCESWGRASTNFVKVEAEPRPSPVKVRLAAINWELECESPTVPQQWTPLWLLSISAIELRSIAFALDKARIHSALFSLNHAIARLGEKALGSGGKSEDQPFSVICQTALDVRAWGETNIFVG